jgi:putative ABC transport system ATP-binding protein
VIRLSDIWRSYDVGGRQLHALVGIDEHVRPGDHVAIMGPSGSGKSTLLNLIGCLDRPTRGSYVLDGREVAALDEEDLSRVRRESIGYVFQAYHLVPRLDAAGNVALPMVFAGVPLAERRTRAAEALASVGLAERAHHRPSEMSGGECQRVAIARATILRPAVLLADEPTGNLDSRAGGVVLDLLDRLHAQGLTLVVVTHDPAVARRAERVIVLRDGKIAHRLPGHDLTSLAASLASEDEPPAVAGGGSAC